MQRRCPHSPVQKARAHPRDDWQIRMNDPVSRVSSVLRRLPAAVDCVRRRGVRTAQPQDGGRASELFIHAVVHCVNERSARSAAPA